MRSEAPDALREGVGAWGNGVNFYKHYIGDFQRDTGHLSLTQRGAYLCLMHHYYATEKPLPNDHSALCRIAGAIDKSEREAVRAVMGFFSVVESGLMHKRIEAEIEKAGKQADTNRQIAVEREAKRKAEREGHESSTNRATNREPNQTPDTNTNTPPYPQGGKKPSAVSLKSWLDAVKASGESPIPEGDAVFVYADSVGIPHDFLRLAWLEFRHRYSQPDAKRYRDWRSVFRKAVRGNWLKLWWLDPGSNQYAMTTVGMQAQRAHQERRQA